MEATRTFTAEEWTEHEQFVQMFRAAKQRKQEWQKKMVNHGDRFLIEFGTPRHNGARACSLCMQRTDPICA
jgi:alpha-L-fucosidase